LSSLLYRLGRAVVRRRKLVVVAWLALVAVLGSGAALFQQGTENKFEIPGAESQEALTHLGHVFSQMSGTQAQLLVTAPPGHRIDAAPAKQALTDTVEHMKHLDNVSGALDPLDPKMHDFISKDGRSAIVMVQTKVDPANVPPQLKESLLGSAHDLQTKLGPGGEAHLGGDLFAVNVPSVGATEAIGVAVALLVLLLMFRSLIAATMPLLTAVIGVGVSGSLVLLTTAFMPVSSAAPMLGIMLGLAVGIDYSLFILSRHRDNLAEGVEPGESIARAVATSGSAVMFAGLTVIIALLALAVPGLPFLAVMGALAGVAIAVGVGVALTLIPALLGFAGARIRPRKRREKRRHSGKAPRKTIGQRWVRGVTKAPLVTILIVIAGLGICALPAKDLQLSLPDAGAQTPGTPARDTYEAISQRFGPGYNAPLIVTTDIIGSHDPLGQVNGMADEIRHTPGVAAVPLATPNPTIDTGLIQVFPTTAGESEETKDLVHRLRGMSGHFQEKYGSAIQVTGMTAIGVDLSQKLGDALLPFGIIVVGLSLILLAMVFRSIWVPVKAAVGYLLSVGATFGALGFVFSQGHLAGILGVTHVGSVVNFLPIVLMGILFGLAMDYEVFLVSRMREEYTHHGDPRRAIEKGFTSVSPVVVSAAAIMIAVFAAFVPHGDANIKPVALGLAFGIFVDAFVVRMTLVPAVMALLGHRAWWLPKPLARRLPELDVEGSALLREIRLADWPSGEDEAISAAGLTMRDDRDNPVFEGVDVHVRPGEVLAVHGGGPTGNSALLYVLGGRATASEGDLKVLGKVLPQHARAVRKRIALISCRDTAAPARQVEAALASGARLILLDDLDSVADPDERRALATLLDGPSTRDGEAVTFACACQSPDPLADVLPLDRLVSLPLPAHTTEAATDDVHPVEV
jgi:RND superfamily putative drug exporter